MAQSLADTPPLCLDCIHHRAQRALINDTPVVFHQCLVMKGKAGPIDGVIITEMECGFMRLGSLCGYEGKLFAARLKG